MDQRTLINRKVILYPRIQGITEHSCKNSLRLFSCAQAENQTEPENAYVAYQNGQFAIVPETVGSKLNIKEAYKVLNAAVACRTDFGKFQ